MFVLKPFSSSGLVENYKGIKGASFGCGKAIGQHQHEFSLNRLA